MSKEFQYKQPKTNEAYRKGIERIFGKKKGVKVEAKNSLTQQSDRENTNTN